MGFDVESDINKYTTNTEYVTSGNTAAWFFGSQDKDSIEQAEPTPRKRMTLAERAWLDAKIDNLVIDWFGMMVKAFTEEVKWETRVKRANDINIQYNQKMDALLQKLIIENQIIKDRKNSAARAA